MKNIVITLKENELTYDIDFMTYKVAKVHFSETAPSVAGEVSTTPSDKDYVTRLLISGIENVRNELSWCASYRHRVSATDAVCPQHTYDLVFRLSDYNRADPRILGSLIHDYITYYAVYHYLLLTSISHATPFAALAESALNKIYLHVREEQPIQTYRLWK